MPYRLQSIIVKPLACLAFLVETQWIWISGDSESYKSYVCTYMHSFRKCRFFTPPVLQIFGSLCYSHRKKKTFEHVICMLLGGDFLDTDVRINKYIIKSNLNYIPFILYSRWYRVYNDTRSGISKAFDFIFLNTCPFSKFVSF